MGPAPRPEAEVEVAPELVRTLVADQHPDLLGPVRAVASGWDNAVFRLGDRLAVRMPRRRLGAELVASEVRWLPVLAPRLPLEVPAPVRVGAPGRGYPWPWAIVRWVPGETVLSGPVLSDRPGLVSSLAGFLVALHRPAPPDAPRNRFRGVPLADRADRFEEHVARLPSDADRGAVRNAWAGAVEEAPWAGPPLWVHGDLHPGNLVQRDGRLVGVLDFGDLTSGDPATDLGVAWMLLDPGERATLRRMLGTDDATWSRARGNALAHAVAVIAHSADAPAMAAMARRTLDAVLSDPPAA